MAISELNSRNDAKKELELQHRMVSVQETERIQQEVDRALIEREVALGEAECAFEAKRALEAKRADRGKHGRDANAPQTVADLKKKEDASLRKMITTAEKVCDKHRKYAILCVRCMRTWPVIMIVTILKRTRR
jgi:hypothetical protein